MRSEATVARTPFGRTLGVFDPISHLLGEQRSLIRCTSALCLVLLGVHASADWIDDSVFALVDLIDSGLDGMVFAVCDWLGSWSSISESKMQSWAFVWAEAIGPEEKEYLSLLFALLAEILIDILIFGFAWGVRQPSDQDARMSDRQRLTTVIHEMKKAMRHGNLELLLIVPAVMLFAISGAFVAGQGIGRLSIEFWLWISPNWYMGRLSAAVGLLFVLLVLKRFLPGILIGAVRRQLQQSKKSSTLATRFRRIILAALLILPLALAAVFAGPGLGTLLSNLWGTWS